MNSPPWRWLPLVFAAVALAFVSATAFTQHRTSAIDHAATEIAINASPSIEVLSVARSEARHLYVLLRERFVLTPGPDSKADEAVTASEKRLDLSLEDYFSQPTFPGEVDLWVKIREGKAGLDDGTLQFERELRQRDFVAARATLDGSLTGNFTELSEGIGDAIALNARHSGELAFEIKRERETSTRLAIVLDVGCVVLTLLASVVLFTGLRSHAALLERHRILALERAVELEQFAGRIAHDILNPIGTVSMALEVADRIDDPAQRKRALSRGRTSVARVKVLVDGLLGFARAGARPEPGAHASVATVIADVVDDNKSAAEEARVELRVGIAEPLKAGGDTAPVGVEAACSTGVLTSLIANLVRNAIKYIGDAPGRTVVVRAEDRSDRVHIEVADSGPGLPQEVIEHAFEPFFRGHNAKGASIGLGLATVRKLVEAHGGVVGYRPSSPAGGCTFWFDLPVFRAPRVQTSPMVARTT